MKTHHFDPNQPNNTMPKLPLKLQILDPQLLIQLNKTNIALATLKGNVRVIPNQKVLIEFSSIKEGVFSNQVENINTTIEEAFIAELTNNKQKMNKETLHYKDTIFFGYEKIKSHGKITINDMIKLNTLLLGNAQGIYSSPHKYIVGPEGIAYTPPQGEEVIKDFLKNFEQVYNGFNEKKEIDPLLKLPMLYYQFEAIHPFGDGNGRIGRILTVLYLVLHNKLNLPILFLSESILLAKQQYYTFLAAIDKGEKNALYDFTLRFLSLIEQQAYKTENMILKIEQLMKETKKILKTNVKLAKIYSHELIDYLFTRPYYDIEGLILMLHIHRNTAASYFSALKEVNLIKSVKIGRENYYYNPAFLATLKYGKEQKKSESVSTELKEQTLHYSLNKQCPLSDQQPSKMYSPSFSSKQKHSKKGTKESLTKHI